MIHINDIATWKIVAMIAAVVLLVIWIMLDNQE